MCIRDSSRWQLPEEADARVDEAPLAMVAGDEAAGERLFAGIVPRDERCVLCLLYTSPSPRDRTRYRMPSSA